MHLLHFSHLMGVLHRCEEISLNVDAWENIFSLLYIAMEIEIDSMHLCPLKSSITSAILENVCSRLFSELLFLVEYWDPLHVIVVSCASNYFTKIKIWKLFFFLVWVARTDTKKVLKKWIFKSMSSVTFKNFCCWPVVKIPSNKGNQMFVFNNE